MKTLPPGIYLTPQHWAQMQTEVAANSTEEACGFVIGKRFHSRIIIPVTNIMHDPFRFRMDPEEELKAFLLAEDKGWEIIAVYHSHPHGISSPSDTDYEELTFPGIIYLIWYQDANQWRCRGYMMDTIIGTGEVPVIISSVE